MSGTLTIGGELRAVVTAYSAEDTWAVESPALPTGWSAFLKSRIHKMYAVGDADLFWVYMIDGRQKTVFLSDSSFGQLPISDRMRPRYRAALAALATILNNPEAADTRMGQDISEAKGMFNRCIRKDQWDWLSVYRLLGEPPPSVLFTGGRLLSDLAKAVRSADQGQVAAIAGELQALDFGSRIAAARRSLEEQTPRLPALRDLTPTARTENGDGESSEVENDEDGFTILSQISRAKMERANQTHRRTLNALVSFLERQGFVVQYNQLVDAYSHLKMGPAIFEVKSIDGGNERQQCRKALSQLYEYRYLHNLQTADLWLVLSQAPAASWLIEYLVQDRGISVMWFEDAQPAGPSAARLLASR